jgi:hypothetical protein
MTFYDESKSHDVKNGMHQRIGVALYYDGPAIPSDANRSAMQHGR